MHEQLFFIVVFRKHLGLSPRYFFSPISKAMERNPKDELQEDDAPQEDDDGDDEGEEEEEVVEDDDNALLRAGMGDLHRVAMRTMANAAQAMASVLQIATTSQTVHHRAIRDLQRFAFEPLGHFRALPPPASTPRLTTPRLTELDSSDSDLPELVSSDDEWAHPEPTASSSAPGPRPDTHGSPLDRLDVESGFSARLEPND